MKDDAKARVEAAYSAAQGVFDSVREQMYERAKSPLVGAFVIAWLAINFRAVYAILTADTYDAAFMVIDTKIWYDWITSAGYGVLLPAATAFFYLYAVPKLERLAVRIWVTGKMDVRAERLKHEGAAPLEAAGAEQYRQHISALESQFRAELATLYTHHNKERSELVQKYETMRLKWSQSLMPEEEVKGTLQNMNETVRDVLWATCKIQGAPHNLISEESVLDALRPIRGEISPRDLSQAYFHLSMYGLTQEELASPSVDGYIRLSPRGRDLAARMETAGFTPKKVVAPIVR